MLCLMSAAQGKILVIRGGAIGDFILTLPVLTALRTQFPTARLEVLGYGHIASLALHGGLVDQVSEIEAAALAGFFARDGHLAPGLVQYFAQFAIIISYLYDPDTIFQTNVARCTKAQFIAGPHRPSETAGVHATHVFLEPLQRLAIFDSDPVPRLQLPLTAAAVSTGAAKLAMHPGSGSETKNWPAAKWLELASRIARETSWHALVVGGEAEGDRLEQVAECLPPDRCRVARNWPLPEVGSALAQCTAFLGHDSGISHLAGALGRPTLVLWGQTSEAVWAPRNPQVRILKGGPGLGALTTAEVFAWLRKLLTP